MAEPIPSPQQPAVVAPSKAGMNLQLIQGVYYVVGGLAVALALGLLDDGSNPKGDVGRMWLVRVIGLVVAGFGVRLVASARRGGRLVAAGAGMWVALALLANTSLWLAFGVLPTTFLIDVGLEAFFFVYWVALMFIRIDKQVSQGQTVVG